MKEAAWLLRQLPELVARGIVDATAAERLRSHYAAAAATVGPGWGMIALSAGGAGLVGLGVILIFAHNWEQWTPGLRVVLSLVPLLLGQASAWHGLRTGSRAWQEGGGVFTALAIGASIALIAQTYQFGGDLPRFLLTWTLLALPLVYLLQSSSVASLCWLGAMGWSLAQWEFRRMGAEPAFLLGPFLLLMALPLPHLLAQLRRDRAGPGVAWMLRSACIALLVGLLPLAHSRDEGMLLVLYAALATAGALAGHRWFGDLHTLWGNPLLSFGRLGVFLIVLLMTWDDAWRGVDLDSPEWLWVPAVPAAIAAWLAWKLVQEGSVALPVLLAALPPVLAALAALDQPVAASVLMHLYALALAGTMIRAGLRQQRLNFAGEGAALLAAIVMIRFFDSDLSYVMRGVGFIVTGSGFFVAVLWLRRRLQGAA